jgi:hypothetical protein
MAYVVPNVFVTATPVAAAPLQANNDALRLYINTGIAQADIADNSVTTADIVRGEFYGVVNDHQFTSGDVYTQNVQTDTFDNSYFTAHINAWDLEYTGRFLEVPNAGKRIVLEEPANVIMTVGINYVGDPNYELFAEKLRSFIYLRHTIGDVVENSDIIDVTRGSVFSEDAVITDASDSGVVVEFSFYPQFVRRWYCTRYVFTNLAAGVHHFVPAVNPRSDKSHISARITNIEVFYR